MAEVYERVHAEGKHSGPRARTDHLALSLEVSLKLRVGTPRDTGTTCGIVRPRYPTRGWRAAGQWLERVRGRAAEHGRRTKRQLIGFRRHLGAPFTFLRRQAIARNPFSRWILPDA